MWGGAFREYMKLGFVAAGRPSELPGEHGMVAAGQVEALETLVTKLKEDSSSICAYQIAG